jgi:hypothetical protein
VIARLASYCFTVLLDIFASTFQSIATGECREQRRENSFKHDETAVVDDRLRIRAQETDAVLKAPRNCNTSSSPMVFAAGANSLG